MKEGQKGKRAKGDGYDRLTSLRLLERCINQSLQQIYPFSGTLTSMSDGQVGIVINKCSVSWPMESRATKVAGWLLLLFVHDLFLAPSLGREEIRSILGQGGKGVFQSR